MVPVLSPQRMHSVAEGCDTMCWFGNVYLMELYVNTRARDTELWAPWPCCVWGWSLGPAILPTIRWAGQDKGDGMPALFWTLHQVGKKSLSQYQPHAAVFQWERKPLAAHVCASTRLSPAHSVPPILPWPQATAAHVLAGHLSHQNMSSCNSMTDGAQTGTLLILSAPLWGLLPPVAPVFSHLPDSFLRFHPYFNRQNHPPTMHLPSFPESKLFFLLFLASYYPGAKNNKEFTALDLELG